MLTLNFAAMLPLLVLFVLLVALRAFTLFSCSIAPNMLGQCWTLRYRRLLQGVGVLLVMSSPLAALYVVATTYGIERLTLRTPESHTEWWDIAALALLVAFRALGWL